MTAIVPCPCQVVRAKGLRIRLYADSAPDRNRMTSMKKIALALGLLFAALGAAPASAQWNLPPKDYAYNQLSLCPKAYERYLACEDQMARFAAAVVKAHENKRKLLVIFGADWCPWCRTIDKNIFTAEYLEHAELKGKVDVVKIALNVLKDSHKVIVPSGQAVQDMLGASMAVDQPSGYIPFYALVDPTAEGVSVGLQNGRFADVIDNKPANIAPAFREVMTRSIAALDELAARRKTAE
jgi:thioredoxin-related protein